MSGYIDGENYINAASKNKELQKKAKVYSTAKIERILDDMKKGYQADMDPFYQGNILYRDAGILFEYTEEELEELSKCADDCVYFVEKYCKFLNDKGRTLVNLRDYQKEILDMYSDEVYDEEIDQFIPKNRYIVILQSRQTAKCLEGNSYVEILDFSGTFLNKIKNNIRKVLLQIKERWKKLIRI